MLIDFVLPKNSWSKVVNIACYVTSRCLIKSILNKTPYKLLKMPKMNYLRNFWCKYFVLNNRKDDLGKFDVRSNEDVFVGYIYYNKAYRVFNKRT